MPKSQRKTFAKGKRARPPMKTIPKATVKFVKSAVAKQLRKDEELKFFTYSTTGTIAGFDNVISWNPFYYVNTGTSNNQLIGDKLKWKGLCLKYKVVNADYVSSALVYKQMPVVLDIYILRTNVYKTLTSLALTDVANESGSNASTFFFNNSTKCLYKKTVRITPDMNGTSAIQQKAVTGKIWLKRNQVIQYKDWGTSYDLKGGQNYYVFFVNRSMSSDKTFFEFTWQNYFTDS